MDLGLNLIFEISIHLDILNSYCYINFFGLFLGCS